MAQIRGIRNFDLWVSTDGTNFTEAVTKASLGDFTIGDGSNQAVQTKTFASISGVTHVELRNLNNWGGSDFYGLSEIRFAAIPEPSAALLGSLGLLALLRRRRN